MLIVSESEAMEENDRKLEGLGFEVFRDGPRPVYRTPRPQSRRLHKKSEVKVFLESEQLKGRLLNVSEDMFSFGKRKRGQVDGNQVDAQEEDVGGGQQEGDDQHRGDVIVDDIETIVEAMVRLLKQESGATTNHRLVETNKSRAH